ncbi:MAG: hypothetical protein PHU63_02575 [Candidatus ainarchaeum sp.]|nr:hypothetical protein [Candidatus ainarchaeum sp.]
MKNITVVSEDRIGLLSDITYILGKSKINIEGVDVVIIGGKAIINLTIKDAEKATQALTLNGYKVMESNVLILKLEDKPGELARVTKLLSDSEVDIQNVHILSKDKKQTIIALVVDKGKKAKSLLQEYLVEESHPI